MVGVVRVNGKEREMTAGEERTFWAACGACCCLAAVCSPCLCVLGCLQGILEFVLTILTCACRYEAETMGDGRVRVTRYLFCCIPWTTVRAGEILV